MKNLKITIVLLLSVAFMLSLAACGKADPPAKPTEKAAQSKEEATQAESVKSEDAVVKAEAFPHFEGKDFDGKKVDSTLFGDNEVTLLNFWFNGCSACVNEMPALEKFNAKLREKGAELIGVNVQADSSQEEFDEAKEILEKQGVTYRNILIDEKQDARAYIAKIFSFPTTIIVDKNGNIVGDPILGNIEDEARQEEILKLIDDIKAGSDISYVISSDDSEQSPEMDAVAELFAKESEIIAKNQDLWDKVFAKIPKDKIQQDAEMSYPDFLKSQIEEFKDNFSDDELKILDADLIGIAKIEAEIQKLTQGK